MRMNNNIQKRSKLGKIGERAVWLAVGALLVAGAHWLFQSPPQKPNVSIVYDMTLPHSLGQF